MFTGIKPCEVGQIWHCDYGRSKAYCLVKETVESVVLPYKYPSLVLVLKNTLIIEVRDWSFVFDDRLVTDPQEIKKVLELFEMMELASG